MHEHDEARAGPLRGRGLRSALVLALAVLAVQVVVMRTPAVSAQGVLLVHVDAPGLVDEGERIVTINWILRAAAPVEHADIHWDVAPRPARNYRFLAAAEDGEKELGPGFPTFTATVEIPPTASTVYFRVHAEAGGRQFWISERSIAVLSVAQSVPDAEAATVFVETPGASGSGFVVNARQILTNQHVVERATEVTVHFAGGTRRQGTVAVVNRELDLAVIEVPDMPQDVRKLDWEAAPRPPPATEVWAWGFPFPLVPADDDEDNVTSATVTRGIISAHQKGDGILYLQTDAAINSGNSGGPLIDADGRVVGINTLKLFGPFGEFLEGLGLALSVADYRDEIGALLAGEAPVPAESVTDIEFLPAMPDDMFVFGFGAARCDDEAVSIDDYRAFVGVCASATYENFEAGTSVQVVWDRDQDTLCDTELFLSQPVLDGRSVVGCDIEDGVRLGEFISGEYSVTFRLYGVVIGEASRRVSVPERAETVTSGDLPRDAGDDAYEDVYRFTAAEGTFVGVIVDTVSDATAFDAGACISTTESVSDCFVIGDDDIECTFPPPLFGCPQFAATLPADADGVYYLRVNSPSASYAGSIGRYQLTVLSTPGIGPLELVMDNLR